MSGPTSRRIAARTAPVEADSSRVTGVGSCPTGTGAPSGRVPMDDARDGAGLAAARSWRRGPTTARGGSRRRVDRRLRGGAPGAAGPPATDRRRRRDRGGGEPRPPGDDAPAAGWLQRAGRPLADLPECAEHGYLRYLVEVEALDGPDPAGVIAAARAVADLGRRPPVCPTWSPPGRSGEGRVLVRQGRVAAGGALLDEAMVAVLAGRAQPGLGRQRRTAT